MTEQAATEPAAQDASASAPEHVPARAAVLGALAYALTRALYATLRVEFVGVERLERLEQGAILVTWHGRTLLAANAFRGRGYWALISMSRDGNIQNEVFRRYGFQTVRGSTRRGGVRATLTMARICRNGGVLAFTPDGPQGPTHKVQLGVIVMAEKARVPVIPVAASASRRWLLSSWDSYLVPKPFSRCRFVVGDPIPIGANLGPDERSMAAQDIERQLNRLESDAERACGHPDYPTEWPTS